MTISIPAAKAFFVPIRAHLRKGSTVVITPWAFKPKEGKKGGYGSKDSYGERTQRAFTSKGRGLKPIILTPTTPNPEEYFSEAVGERMGELKRYGSEELGLASKVVIFNEAGPTTLHVEQLDFEPDLTELKGFEPDYGMTILNSGNSFHAYGNLLLPQETFQERLMDRLLSKEPVDAAWVGFTIRQGFSVLRVSGITKPLPYPV